MVYKILGWFLVLVGILGVLLGIALGFAGNLSVFSILRVILLGVGFLVTGLRLALRK